jgi:hypothetical protein
MNLMYYNKNIEFYKKTSSNSNKPIKIFNSNYQIDIWNKWIKYILHYNNKNVKRNNYKRN